MDLVKDIVVNLLSDGISFLLGATSISIISYLKKTHF